MYAKQIAEIRVTEAMIAGEEPVDLSTEGTYRFRHQGLIIDAFVRLRPDTDRLFWMGQSALTEELRKRLPVYNRISWADCFEASVVIFNDPTLYLYSDIICGWSQGSPKHFGIDAMSDIVTLIRNAIDFPIAKSLFYGSSAGGFWALFTAALHEGECFIEVPQTDMFEYWIVRHRELLLDRCYRDHGLDPHNYAHRLRALDWFRHLGRYPSMIHYYQSETDQPHIEGQMEPFLAGLKEDGYDRVDVHLYPPEDGPHGHMPMGKGEAVSAIRKVLYA